MAGARSSAGHRHQHRHGHAARQGALLRAVAAMALLAACTAAVAQSTPGPDDASVNDRARRDAERVFHWIRLHGELARRKADEKAGARRAADAKDTRSTRGVRPGVPAAAVATQAVAAEARVAEAEPAAPESAPAPASAPGSPVVASPIVASSAGTGTVESAASASASAAASAASEPEPAEVAASAVLPADTGPELPPPAAAQAAAGFAPTAAPDGAAVGPEGPVAEHPAPAANGAPEDLVVAHQVEPEFGSVLMRSLRKGEALVRLQVRPDGSVGQVEVVRSTHPRLHAAVLAAVAQWRFRPVSRPQSALVELGFNLD